mgnify:CR=1 FL=1
MKLLTFRSDSGLKLGVKTERGVLDVERSIAPDDGIPCTIGDVLRGGDAGLRRLEAHVAAALERGREEWFLQEDELQWGPCVPHPGKIVCVGLNYRKHAEESNMPIPQSPVLFSKFNNTPAGHRQVVYLPAHSEQIDYEAELAIVVGRRAKNVLKREALGYVFGYCAANDLSARDLQFRTSQWLLGKNCDGFCPLGPYLVTADEVGNPNALRIRSYVNGEVRQDSNTADMIFPCDELVSYISHYMTLEPGDIILTGTPEGVIMGYPEERRVWLKSGDTVTIEIEKLGSLSNTLAIE